MGRHGSSIMANEYTVFVGGLGENFQIAEAFQVGLVRGLKVDFGQAAKHAAYDVFVEIGVCLKTNLHDWEVKLSSRARRSLSYQSGCVSREASRSSSNFSSP